MSSSIARVLRNGEDAAMRKTLRSGPIETARRPPLQSPANAIGADVPSTTTGLEAELAELERLSLDDLRLRWRNNWGRLAPAHLSRGLLLRVMAYRLQAEAFGDLDRKTIRILAACRTEFFVGDAGADFLAPGRRNAVREFELRPRMPLLTPSALRFGGRTRLFRPFRRSSE